MHIDFCSIFFFQAEDGIRDYKVTGVQTCALPICADTFKKGINASLQAHAYGNATSEDFSKSIAAASGKPVERILPTFVNQPGVPLLDVSVACANNQTAVTLKQQRFVIDAARAETGR